MIYQYICDDCKEIYNIIQKADDEHEHVCPKCKIKCRRIFTVPSVKKNEGFYSDMLGKWVSSQTEFDEEYAKTNYITDMNTFVGEHGKPKDEWVEQKETELQERKKTAAEELAENEE